jgi:hypothetical protein
MYHWRTGGGAEVDLVLDYNGTLYPIEIKSKTSVTNRDAQGIKAFYETYPNQKKAPGIILYTGDYSLKINEYCIAIPWNSFSF